MKGKTLKTKILKRESKPFRNSCQKFQNTKNWREVATSQPSLNSMTKKSLKKSEKRWTKLFVQHPIWRRTTPKNCLKGKRELSFLTSDQSMEKSDLESQKTFVNTAYAVRSFTSTLFHTIKRSKSWEWLFVSTSRKSRTQSRASARTTRAWSCTIRSSTTSWRRGGGLVWRLCTKPSTTVSTLGVSFF